MDDKTNFSELSISLTNKLDKEIKKNEGIFFSSKNTVNKTIDIILREVDKQGLDIKNVLEPSCGSCEFINGITKRMNGLNITCVENNQTIYNEIKDLEWNNNKVKLINSCFFKNYKENNEKKYDLIIGNPPYFVIKKNMVNDLVGKDVSKYINGRPNIYILFILLSLKILNDKGILAFVLPNNFLNCQYYNKVRKLISDEYTIIDILVSSESDFLETEQGTCIIVIQKISSKDNSLFTHVINENIIFNSKSKIEKIQKLLENSTNLANLGMYVSVGKVVWNENKDILTDDVEKTRLIYSGDIKNNKLVLTNYTNPLKKNFILKDGIKKPLLVINRGYGKGKYSFQYAIIDLGDKPFLVENHLICIDWNDDKKITNNNKIKQYNKIIESFTDKRTEEFISLYFENNAINTSELETIVPIYIS